MIACPSCKKGVDSRADDKFFPFCSERCRLLDLGAWFNEQHRIPANPVEFETEQKDPYEIKH